MLSVLFDGFYFRFRGVNTKRPHPLRNEVFLVPPTEMMNEEEGARLSVQVKTEEKSAPRPKNADTAAFS